MEHRRQLELVRLAGLEHLACVGVHVGGSALHTAERAARSLVAAAPFRESAQAALLEVLAQGNRAEALRAYDRVRCLLSEGLGLASRHVLQARHPRLQPAGPALDGDGWSGRGIPALTAPMAGR